MLDLADRLPAPNGALEAALDGAERLIRQLRARQIEMIASLDREQVASRDGARSLQDWVAARLDMDPDAAKALVRASQLFTDHPAPLESLASGDVGFDRAFAEARLAALGAGRRAIETTRDRDMAGVRRVIARYRRTTRRAEREALDEQYLAVQPSLDESRWHLWGQLTGADGKTVHEALLRRRDDLPNPVVAMSGNQRNALALVTLAQDSLDARGTQTSERSAEPIVTVFVDLETADESGGRSGAEIAAGPTVGPETLERVLCEGRVQVVGLRHLKPVAASAATRAISPSVRRFVLWRDGGCVVDGCSSLYRLQPHHIVRWADGGTHEPDNLATLCWYHHHVAVHGSGFRLDPTSPPQRRRLLPPVRGPDPPEAL